MKRFLKSFFEIFLYIAASVGLVLVFMNIKGIARTSDNPIDYTRNQIPVETGYSPDQPIEDGGEYYYEHFKAYSAYMCGQHGSHMYIDQPTTATIEVTMKSPGGKVNVTKTWTKTWPEDFGGADQTTVTENLWTFGGEENIRSAPDMTIKITPDSYPGTGYAADLHCTPQGQTNTWTGKLDNKVNHVNINEVRKNRHDLSYERTGHNDALAYILCEGDNDAGLAPRHSYVNVAFWTWQKNPGPYGNLPASTYSGSTEAPSPFEYDELEDSTGTMDNGDENEGDDFDTESLGNSASGGALLFKEAVTFERMWSTIDSVFGGDYMNSVVDQTELEKVKVEFDAVELRYTVGPFKLNYLEVYENNANFCGMCGTPVLMVNDDGAERKLKFGEEWEYYFPEPREAQENIPDVYDRHPHNGEEFYIRIKYQEGINKITKMGFNFRWLGEANGSFKLYLGWAEIMRWYVATNSTWCSDCVECDGTHNGIPCKHDSPKVHKCSGCTCPGHGSGRNRYYCSGCVCPGYNCSGGKHSHELSNGTEIHNPQASPKHLIKVDVLISIEYIEDIDVQDIAHNEGASRKFIGLKYDADIDESENYKEFEWEVDLTTTLAGYVWLDKDSDKIEGEFEDGLKESSEDGVENVPVRVKLYKYNGGVAEYIQDAISHEQDGKNKADNVEYTDSNGYYEFNRLEAPGTDNGDQKCFYVIEFIYDGQVYESTVYLEKNGQDDTSEQYMANPDNYADNSMAVENAGERGALDESFESILGGTPVSGGETTGKSSKGVEIQYTQNPDAKTGYEDEDDMKKSAFISTATADHKNMRQGFDEESPYNIKAYTYYKDDSTRGGPENCADYRIMYPIVEGNYAGDVKYIMNMHNETDKRYIDEYMLHINLGLEQRKESDMSILKDLYKVSVVVNEQELVLEYNNLVNEKEATTDFQSLQKILEEKRKQDTVNNLGLYNTDVAYCSALRYKQAIDEVQELKAGTELRVFATYSIRVYNNSDTYDVTINELKDYYDPTFTLIDEENQLVKGADNDERGIFTSIVTDDMGRTIKKIADYPYYRILTTNDSRAWKPSKKETLGDDRSGDLEWNTENTKAGGFNVSTTTSLRKQKLKIGEYAEIFTTYEIDNEGYSKISGIQPGSEAAEALMREALKGDKNNVVEISNYSTYYSDLDMKDVNYYKPYFEGAIAGKIDKDSAPDNIDTTKLPDDNDHEEYEDDTSKAIKLKIYIENYERDMYGYVFEDVKDVKNGDEPYRGDGVYTEGKDKLIPNVRVSLFEVINLAEAEKDTINHDFLEYYYEVPIEYYNIPKNADGDNDYYATGNGEPIYTQNTSVNGKKGNYYIYGFLAGDYILRFDYGTKSDAKATVVTMDEAKQKKYVSLDGSGNITLSDSETQTDIIKYNGQDYENTAFLYDTKSYEGENETLDINNKFLNLRQEHGQEKVGVAPLTQIDGAPAVSTARDNEARRMTVNAYSRTIENDRGEILRDRLASDSEENGKFISGTQMFAETPIMKIELMEPKSLNSDDKYEGTKVSVTKTVPKTSLEKGKDHEYSVKNINFGLEERARTDLDIEQSIESIFLMKDEEIIFYAKLLESGELDTSYGDNRGINKLTYVSHEVARDTNQQGFHAISVEDEFLNGLTVKIRYDIKVSNESEEDYTGLMNAYKRSDEIIAAAAVKPTLDTNTEEFENWFENGIPTNSTLSQMVNSKTGIQTDNKLMSLLQDEYYSGRIDGDISVRDTLRPDIIIYGRYVGRYYYENKIGKTADIYTIINYRNNDFPNKEVGYDTDNVVTTTVNQLVDYVDVDASYDLDTQSLSNASWDLSDTLEKAPQDPNAPEEPAEPVKKKYDRITADNLDSIISESAFTTENGRTTIYDNKKNALITDSTSNIVMSRNRQISKLPKLASYAAKADSYLTTTINPNWVEYREDYNDVTGIENESLSKALFPKSYAEANGESYQASMRIRIGKTTASDIDANNMKFDNLVEILVYSNEVGRRDVTSVPGNAMALGTKEGFWKAGYNVYSTDGKPSCEGPDIKICSDIYSQFTEINDPNTPSSNFDWVTKPEDDAWAPEYVTIIAPTGIAIREYFRNVIVPIIILAVAMAGMGSIFIIKQKRIYKGSKKDE